MHTWDHDAYSVQPEFRDIACRQIARDDVQACFGQVFQNGAKRLLLVTLRFVSH
jgi:hypothetical protein